jgi:hypothetical protein
LLKALAAIFGGSLLVVALGIIAFCRSEVGQAAWGPAKEMPSPSGRPPVSARNSGEVK